MEKSVLLPNESKEIHLCRNATSTSKPMFHFVKLCQLLKLFTILNSFLEINNLILNNKIMHQELYRLFTFFKMLIHLSTTRFYLLSWSKKSFKESFRVTLLFGESS